MFHLHRPTDSATAAFLKVQCPLPFRYRADLVGATRGVHISPSSTSFDFSGKSFSATVA